MAMVLWLALARLLGVAVACSTSPAPLSAPPAGCELPAAPAQGLPAECPHLERRHLEGGRAARALWLDVLEGDRAAASTRCCRCC